MILALSARLALTLAIETPIAAALASRGNRREVGACALFANLASFTLATWLMLRVGIGFLPAEGLVLGLETVAYVLVGGLSWQRSLGIAGLANGLTVWLALVL